MADLIRIKAGSGDVPTLQDREIAYSRSEKALYIGTKDGNVRLCGVDDLTEINSKIKAITDDIDSIKAEIENITARLDALTPSE